MPHFKATLLWFAYGPDAACLIQSVRAALHHAPDSPRVIAQDVAKPLPLDVQDQLRALGCQVETDFCDRQGNLNGLAHFAHQLEWMEAASHSMPADAQRWVVKIDCDTLINAPLATWIGEAGPIHDAVCAVQPTWWFQGPCYAVRAESLPPLRRHLAAHPQALGECAPKYQEDRCMGHLLSATFGPQSILALPGGHSSTLFHGLQIAHFDYRTWPSFATYEAFRTLHFGNRSSLPNQMPDPVRRASAGETMRRYCDEIGIPP